MNAKHEKRVFTGVSEIVNGTRQITIPMDDITSEMELVLIHDPLTGEEYSAEKINEIKKAFNKLYFYKRAKAISSAFSMFPKKDAAHFLEYLRQTDREAYIRKTFGFLSSAYDNLIQADLAKQPNPFSEVSIKGGMKTPLGIKVDSSLPSKESFHIFLDALCEDSIQTRLVFLLICYFGVAPEDVCSLQYKDFHHYYSMKKNNLQLQKQVAELNSVSLSETELSELQHTMNDVGTMSYEINLSFSNEMTELFLAYSPLFYRYTQNDIKLCSNEEPLKYLYQLPLDCEKQYVFSVQKGKHLSIRSLQDRLNKMLNRTSLSEADKRSLKLSNLCKIGALNIKDLKLNQQLFENYRREEDPEINIADEYKNAQHQFGSLLLQERADFTLYEISRLYYYKLTAVDNPFYFAGYQVSKILTH